MSKETLIAGHDFQPAIDAAMLGGYDIKPIIYDAITRKLAEPEIQAAIDAAKRDAERGGVLVVYPACNGVCCFGVGPDGEPDECHGCNGTGTLLAQRAKETP